MKGSIIAIFFALFAATGSFAFSAASPAGLSVQQPLAIHSPNAGWPALAFEQVVGDLDFPVHMTDAGDGSGRLFIVEQGGVIRIYQNGLLSNPFLDITDRVRSPQSGGGSEEGLLSAAFPPGYGSLIHHFYVYYTNKNGDNQVSRFRLTSDPIIADPDSEELIIYFNHPVNSNHNGGQLAFGPDGYMYIGTGDGGGGGDPQDNAQNPASLLGKLLRIDVETDPTPSFTPSHWIFLPQAYRGEGGQSPLAYSIPPDNPFVGLKGYREEIWALGLRNPWRFSFDRSTSDLYIGDVGQQQWEEVDFQPASSGGGENYGWDNWEADACYEGPCNNPTGYIFPIFDYPHNNGNCSISGGYTYRGQLFSGMTGIYFFADYCSGNIWGLQNTVQGWESHDFIENTGGNISSFGEDESGELYLVRRADDTGLPGTGMIYHIVVGAH